MKFGRLTELMLEMPVNKFEKLGNEDDWKTRQTFDKHSHNDLNNPEYGVTVKKAFENSDTDFNLYFLNNKEVGHIDSDNFQGEMGVAEEDSSFWNSAGLNYSDFQDDDSVSIIFVGNSGDKLVKMTPWVLAHRIGHAIQSNKNQSNNTAYSIKSIFEEIENTLVMLINYILEDYKIPIQIKSITDYKYEKEILAVMHRVGTFKSARTNSITRPYEFIYECFAQYLITGEVKFNEELKPITLSDEDEHDPYTRKYKFKKTDVWYTNNYGRGGIEYYFNDLLGEMVGKVLVM